jgi:hypothetical protein
MMTELYTDESPGLKVDPVVVLVLSLVFIFSVVALHSTSLSPLNPFENPQCLRPQQSLRRSHAGSRARWKDGRGCIQGRGGRTITVGQGLWEE